MSERKPCGMCQNCLWQTGTCAWLLPSAPDPLTGDPSDPRRGRTWRNLGGGRYEEVATEAPTMASELVRMSRRHLTS